MGLKQGWKRRSTRDFEPGDTYKHALGRTVTATDNSWFNAADAKTPRICISTWNYASTQAFGKPLVNSWFTIALVTGQSVAGYLAERLRQSGLGRGASAASRLRGRHHLFRIDRAGKARERITTGCRHRQGGDHRHQPAWRYRDLVQADPARLQERPGPW